MIKTIIWIGFLFVSFIIFGSKQGLCMAKWILNELNELATAAAFYDAENGNEFKWDGRKFTRSWLFRPLK